MAIQKRRNRMYEPWGYVDENNYQGSQIILENDLDSFFSGVSYKKEDNKIHFTNKDGEEVGSLDVNDFIKSDQIVEKAWYEDGKIYIKFTNGDLITIDVKELLDENEFADGLQVEDGVVSVLKDPESEKWITISLSGVKISGIQAEIDRLDERIDEEIERATSEEERIEGKLDQEIQDRIDDVDAEESRAKAEELRIETKLDNEITRATQAEQGLTHRADTLNDELDAEKSTRESNDAALSLRIEQEIARATVKEEELDDRIDQITSGTPIAKLDELIEKLGYKDNDTLVRSNEHEVAFGEWNISNTSADPSGQTMFSIGIGTSEDDRKNALEVMKDGTVYMWVEGDYMNVNKILGQIAHEVYDNG